MATCEHRITPKRDCRDCRAAISRAHYRRYPERDRNRRLKKMFGISLEEYNQLLAAQGGGCAICGTKPKNRALHVDHNHKTGDVRGILCWWCNGLVGKLRDRPELADACATYLRRSPFRRGTAVKGPVR